MSSQRLDESACGVFIISATPFDEQGELDLDSADRLVDFYLEKGVSGITILGMMGEAQKMAAAESQAFLERVLAQVNGIVPVIVGVSNPDLDDLVELSKISMDKGAAGVMIAPLTGLSSDDAVYDYFSKVFAALGDGIPVCFQDYPLVTQTNLSVPLFNRMVADYDQLVMLKHEDCPGRFCQQGISDSRNCSRGAATCIYSGRKRWFVSTARTGTRCRWCDDRLRLSGNAGGCSDTLSNG